jgi:hypothetical protein
MALDHAQVRQQEGDGLRGYRSIEVPRSAWSVSCTTWKVSTQQWVATQHSRCQTQPLQRLKALF